MRTGVRAGTLRRVSQERSLSRALGLNAQTGALLAHEEKKKTLGSFEDLQGELTKQKELREQLFAQEMSSMKDRERMLDEKFKEAMKRAEGEKDTPFRNPLDMD